MAETAGGLLEKGIFQVYLRGAVHLVLSPEGDSHRLIGLAAEPGGGLSGMVMAVTGRLATLLEALPRADGRGGHAVAAGEYRLRRKGGTTEIAFDPVEGFGAPGERPAPFARAVLARLAVRHPRVSPGGCAVLPPRLARKLQGRSMAPADPPDFLDYPGVQLLITPVAVAPARRYGGAGAGAAP